MTHAMNQLGAESNGALVAYSAGTAGQGGSEYLRQLRQEQEQLSERYGPQYSKVRELEEQISRAKERVRNSRGRADQGDAADLIGALEQSLKASQAMRAEIAKLQERDIDLARKAEGDQLTEANLRSNLERRRALANAVADQLKQAQFVRDYSNINFRTIEPVNAGPGPVSPRARPTLMLAVFVGLLLGGCLTLAAAYFDGPTSGPVDWRPLAGLTATKARAAYGRVRATFRRGGPAATGLPPSPPAAPAGEAVMMNSE
jgi:uncharacterized protein involved in exopolysaccharide biosynthesis